MLSLLLSYFHRSLLISTSQRDDNQCLKLRFPKNRPETILTEVIQTSFPVKKVKWAKSGKYFFTLEQVRRWVIAKIVAPLRFWCRKKKVDATLTLFYIDQRPNVGSRLLRYCSRTLIALDAIIDCPRIIDDFLLLNEDDPTSAAQVAVAMPPANESR